jgi:CelD/BcsL family acetyltransferase involved in cellulose biosynthesis
MTVAALAQLAVEEVNDRAAIAALSPAWEGLRAEVAAAHGTAGPFLAPAWFAIYAAGLGRDLRILVVHRAGRIVGILPLLRERRRLAGLPARLLRSLSDDHSQRFDVLLSPSEPDRVAAALFSHLASRSDWDALELREIPDGESGAARLIWQARAEGHLTRAWTAMRSPYLLLDDSSPGDAKFRANLRRRRKNLESELGPVALERVEARGRALERALDEGLALEAAGWKGAKNSAILCHPELVRRYRQLAHAFAARRELALHFLTAGGRRVAFHFALIENHTYFLFKPGFDPALSRYGLGHLLVDAVASDLKQRGVRELDFLGDDAPWKRDWTQRVRPHSWQYVFARSPYGRILGAWKFGVAPKLKRLLQR